MSGVCPLAVFLDGTGTVGLTQGDYVSASFGWDYGDPSSGTWGPTGRSRNQGTGFLGAHVYEQPGSYPVRLSVKDKAGATGEGTVTIQAQAFTGSTYYISSSLGDDANDGLFPESQGSGHGPWRSLGKLRSALGQGNARVLLRRGETYPILQTLELGPINPAGSYRGPAIVGAYGQGNRPKLQVQDPNITAIEVENCHELSLMDLEIEGRYGWGGGPPSADHLGIVTGSDVSRLLLLRVEVHGFYYGVLWEGQPIGEAFIVDSYVHHNYLIDYGSNSGRHLALLGNRMEDTRRSHNVYSYFQEKYLVADNRFARPGWVDPSTYPTDGQFYANRANLRLAIHEQDAKDVGDQAVPDEAGEDRRGLGVVQDGQGQPGDDRGQADDLPDEALEDAVDGRHDHQGQEEIVEPVHAAASRLSRNRSTMP